MLTRVLNIASCCVLTRVLFCVSMQQIYTSKRCVNTCFFTRLFAGYGDFKCSHDVMLRNMTPCVIHSNTFLTRCNDGVLIVNIFKKITFFSKILI